MVRSELHAEVKTHRLCLNCLRPFHSHDKCKSPGCKHCGRKHNTLLHIPKNDTLAEPKKVAAVDMPNALNTNKENLEQTINLHCSSKTTQVLLATVQLDVLNNNGVPVRARAILDSDSQTSFMTKGLANKLNLPFIETSTPVASINSTLNKINTKVSTDIQSLQENYCKNETFLIIDNITERLPQITFDISKLDIPANIRLADNDCHLTNPVDILLGAGIFFESLSVGQIKLGPDKPILQKTKFGWSLSGTLIVSNETPTFLCNFVTSDNGLNMQLEQFWKLEEASRNIVYSKEEQECEEHFAKNYKRNDQGRFQVALPLKDNFIKLGESETQAISRFHKLEKTFHQDTNFKSEYCKFMSDDSIINDFSMDDILSGHDTVQHAIRLKNEITNILHQSGFVLRKFRSNHQSVVEDDMQTIEGEYQMFKDENCKTLGLLWNTTLDIFCYSVHMLLKVVTKRTILSAIARIFDPLGLIAPITIVAKLILQKLWQSNSDWDKSVSMELYTTWNKFFKNLHMINNIKIPRQVTVTNHIKIELHGFCDSSQMAYGCCIYIVSVDSFNKRVSKLLCAKSRVAPLKTVTLPRLELCGALLLAQLSRKCEKALNMVIDEKIYWCDSTITLNWIAGQPNSTEQNQWRYVSSEQNPADLITRGTTLQCLESTKLWWRGPDFLMECKESWPNNIVLDPVSNTLEKRKTIALSFVNVMGQDQDIFERFSSFKKLIRGRTKWKSDSPTPIKVGSLVLLKEPTLPQHWRLGRVVELHPGKDNIPRVVSVHTRSGIVKRSVPSCAVYRWKREETSVVETSTFQSGRNVQTL
nr:unnamed protein product [Callosobruchus analis]